jgi:hypothetical protein
LCATLTSILYNVHCSTFWCLLRSVYVRSFFEFFITSCTACIVRPATNLFDHFIFTTLPMTPTIYVQLLPTLPPAPNVLGPGRRLRSTRKGTTPLVLDLDSKVDIIPKAPKVVSPRTRAIRRTGRVFHTQSSTSAMAIESDYVFVNIATRPDLQPHSPPSSRSPTSNIKPVSKENNSRPGKSGEIDTKHSKGPQTLAQPFLLRLRSLPDRPGIKTGIPPIDPSKPLSPISPSLNMDTTTTASRRVLTDNEKRRKLAKLARTLGENVPPELVFNSTLPLQRTTSMSVSQPPKSPPSHTSSFSTPLPIGETPTPQPQSARRPEKPLKQRQPRPRSMALTTSQAMATHSAIADTHGTRSLDHISVPVDNRIDSPFGTAMTADATQHDTLSVEWGRRKEREWSGEWNVKDMDHVTRTLRGLKAR